MGTSFADICAKGFRGGLPNPLFWADLAFPIGLLLWIVSPPEAGLIAVLLTPLVPGHGWILFLMPGKSNFEFSDSEFPKGKRFGLWSPCANCSPSRCS